MKKRLLLAPLFAALVIAMCDGANTSSAAPISKAALSFSSPDATLTVKVGCGWDYPCAPRPSYGRRSYRSSQVYIENNYGTVNIYRNPPRYRGYRPAYYGHPWRWSERRYDDWHGYRRCDGNSCSERRCDSDRCADSCGVFCWYHRIRHGYCGHGCDVYREHVRYERDYREVEYPRAYRYRSSPDDGYDYDPHARYEDPHVRYERPSDSETVPVRRFDGPRFPSDCSPDRDC